MIVFEAKNASFDFARNINLFITGAFYIAPALHVWYCKLLPRIATKLFPNFSNTSMAFGKMAVDQLGFAPILLSGFFPFVGMVNSRSLEGLKIGVGDIKTKLWDTLLANWKIWPLASTINFMLMPLKYQVLFANFVGLFWNMILSYIAYK